MENKEEAAEETKEEVAPTGVVSKRDGYSVEIKYSPEAIEKKLIRFTTPSGDSFVVSTEEMIALLVEHVNLDTLAPTFVDTQRVNVVQVQRQIRCQLNRDYKEGEVINVGYTHPYPLEFAILEEAYKIAAIDTDRGVQTLTAQFIDKVKEDMKPNMDKMLDYSKKFYSTFKSIDLKDPTEGEKTEEKNNGDEVAN